MLGMPVPLRRLAMRLDQDVQAEYDELESLIYPTEQEVMLVRSVSPRAINFTGYALARFQHAPSARR